MTKMTEECLKTDLTYWEIGPYDTALSVPVRLKLKLDGEIIVSGEVEAGFLHRGLEKAMERQLWKSTIPYADRLDPEGSVFGELALCLAVEQLAGLEVPARAQTIRVILSELNRISMHLAYVVRVARAVGSDTMIHLVLRDREKILDLFELVTGARFSVNFLRFGGVQADVTEGFIERVLETCELLRIRLKEYNDLFTYNHSFINRTRGIGQIHRQRALALGITGPNGRASGVPLDVRKDFPYSGYERFDFEVPMGSHQGADCGDANDRFLLRLREISAAVDVLKQAAESVPAGAFTSAKGTEGPLVIPPGEAYARVESARGVLGCYVISDGGTRPVRVQFRPPSLAHLQVLPDLVEGVRIEDLPVLFATLDPGIAEADR